MTLYADSSALLKRYVDEPDSERAVSLLASDDELVTGRHTVVEVRRNLARLLEPSPWSGPRSKPAAPDRAAGGAPVGCAA